MLRWPLPPSLTHLAHVSAYNCIRLILPTPRTVTNTHLEHVAEDEGLEGHRLPRRAAQRLPHEGRHVPPVQGRPQLAQAAQGGGPGGACGVRGDAHQEEEGPVVKERRTGVPKEDSSLG